MASGSKVTFIESEEVNPSASHRGAEGFIISANFVTQAP